jgi:hypothetical protein
MDNQASRATQKVRQARGELRGERTAAAAQMSGTEKDHHASDHS